MILQELFDSLEVSLERHLCASVKPFRNRSGSIVGNIPVTTTTKIFPKVLRYKWEAYCNTNGGAYCNTDGRSTGSIPFPQSVGAPKVLQYKLEAYCDTNWRCIAILFEK